MTRCEECHCRVEHNRVMVRGKIVCPTCYKDKYETKCPFSELSFIRDWFYVCNHSDYDICKDPTKFEKCKKYEELMQDINDNIG